ncbi:hypothetical protein ASG92_24905 [Arthrobacter sp. Soil736]|nr:hypothetical protein ASG92_24905 [Arthrobacter sp. Soil736]
MIPTPYEDLLADIPGTGVARSDRTGTGAGTRTFGVFGRHIRYDLSQRFPLITTTRGTHAR